ncbi:Pol Polyprotein, partial [Phytophthora megakarya]
WTIDSGCTRHVSHESQWFTDITNSGGSITVGGNNQTPIEGIGRVKLEVSDSKDTMQKYILHGVLYAPPLQFSLLSVPAAVMHDFRFSFGHKQCAMQTNQRFKIKAHMANNTDLYQFQANPAVPPTALIASGKQRSFLLLYKRLGHPNVRGLNDLSRSQAIHGLDGSVPLGSKIDFFCVSCTLAKSHRSPFYSNRVVKRATSPLSKFI